MRVLFILNPKSGRRRYAKTRATIENFCTENKIEAEIWIWESIEEIDRILDQALEEKFDGIFACGGDGTINRVGTRLMGTDVPLGVIPVGTGNAFASHFSIPLKVEEALKVLTAHKVVTIDSARINGEPYICFAGFGLDAVVAHAYAHVEKRSFFKYITLSYRYYLRHRPEEYSITVNGETTQTRTFILSINNVSEFGNRAVSAPGASTTDGLLDLVGLTPFPFWKLPMIIYRIFSGTIDRTAHFSQQKCTEATIKRLSPLSVAQIDGEPAEFNNTIRVEVVPASLKVIIPVDANNI